MTKKLMILGASILQLPAIENAKRLGLETIVVDMNPNAIGFNVPGIRKEIMSTNDTTGILNAAKRLKIDGIMTLATDMPMRTVAKVSSEMDLVGISEDTALKATNKAEMRKALLKNEVPIPKFYKVSNKEQYIEVVQLFNSAIIVKPVDSSGSRGIVKVMNVFDKEAILNAYDYSLRFSNTGDILVEEYMVGPEVSVETISIDGTCHVIQITDKVTTGSPHFVEIGHSQPTLLSKEISRVISEITIAANQAIGIDNGPSHTEIIVTNEGPKIVEIGARLGGDNISTHLVPLSTGINIVEACIKIAIGEKPDIDKKWNMGSAIRYFHPNPGIISEINGIDDAKYVNGIEQISVVHGKGEIVTEIESSSSRMGFVIAQDKDALTAIDDCELAIKKIRIETRQV